jgi:hypothetical protein
MPHHHQRASRRAAYSLIAVVLLLAGCRTGAKVKLPEDPARRIAVANGILAQANNSAAKVTIKLAQAKLISGTVTAEVLVYNERIARASRGIAMIQTKDRPLAEQKGMILEILKAITPRSFYSKYLTLTDAKLAELESAVSALESAVTLLKIEVSK